MLQIHNFFKNIYSYMAARTAEAECQFYVLAIMITLGYLVFYLLWHDVSIQGYENFTIRFVASLLGIPLLLKKYIPKRWLAFFPFFWYLSLLYLFPFFYSFMMLKNNFSTLWQLNSIVGLTILVILVDWLSTILLIVCGSLLGWFFYVCTTANPQLPLATLENISTCYLSIIAFGGFFIHNKSRFQQERISALSNFADMIAHELRTPLTSINITGGSLKRWLPPLLETYHMAEGHKLNIPHIDKRIREKLTASAASIQVDCAQAQQIINMLLINAESKKIEPARLQTCFIVDLINDALESYAFDLSDRNLIEFKSDINFKVRANNFFINIIFNLIRNSLHQIRAADKGKITIWATVGDKYNEVHFKDTAKGMSKQKLALLFKPFTSDTQHGTGLGLASCKEIMESYGGTIRCEAQEGEYAEFILSFPKVSKNQN